LLAHIPPPFTIKTKNFQNVANFNIAKKQCQFGVREPFEVTSHLEEKFFKGKNRVRNGFFRLFTKIFSQEIFHQSEKIIKVFNFRK
jgi:hypothetical protein